MVRPDGTIRWIRDRGKPLGIGTLVAGVAEDITEHKRIDAELRSNEERLRLAQAAGKIGTFDWDIIGGAVTWSPELQRLWGLPVGGFGGTYDDWRRQIHPEDIAKMEQLTQRTLVDLDQPYRLEYRIIHPDGTERWIAVHATIVRDEAGRPLRMVGINMDITERKLTEGDLRQQQAKQRAPRPKCGQRQAIAAQQPHGQCDMRSDQLKWSRHGARMAKADLPGKTEAEDAETGVVVGM